MSDNLPRNVAKEYRLNGTQLKEIFRLLDSGYSVPYIARYHKELAGGLSADEFYKLVEEKRRIRKLERRRRKMLGKLTSRGVLTEELEKQIRNARDMRELIDYYVPHRPRKRSRSRQALAQGLGELAAKVLSQEELVEDLSVAAAPYVQPESGPGSVPEVIEGVVHIMCDWMAEDRSHRDRQRQVLRQKGIIVSRRSRKKVPDRIAREFREYFDFRQVIGSIHPYRLLCIIRGVRLNVLRYEIEPSVEEMWNAAVALYLPGTAKSFSEVTALLEQTGTPVDAEKLAQLNSTELVCLCMMRSIRDVLVPILVREIERELLDVSQNLALDILKRNLRSLLMTQCVCGHRVLGISPGYRTGCKLAALDETGEVLEVRTVFPHIPHYKSDEAKDSIGEMVERHNLGLVAIGDGTACQETEALISELIGTRCRDLRYAVVSEAGLPLHGRGETGRKGLIDVPPEHCASVSIGKRLLDPLKEFVKVPARELCGSQYVHDVNPASLKRALDQVIEECVCAVGVELNSASEEMLRGVSGIDAAAAAAIVRYREENGPFKSREELKNVPGITEEAFRQAVGFVRTENGQNPLDRTRIHPDFYPVCAAIAQELSIPQEVLCTEECIRQVKEKRSQIKLGDLERQHQVHYLLLKDIIEELIEPWPDPRADSRPPILRQRQMTFEDLQAGQTLQGTVRSVVDFGVFVDVGVSEDGLIHVSELADHYVQSPFDLVSVGDLVQAAVVEVDSKKRRIALSMRSEQSRQAGTKKHTRKKPTGQFRQETVGAAREPAERVPAKPTRGPQSTAGPRSRRVEKAKLERPLSKTDAQILRPKSSQPEPAKRKPDRKGKEKTAGSGLLTNLDFADIEKRGEPSQ